MNQETARRSRRGFTLLELLMVIGVIAVLAALSIPRLLEGKSVAYETGAMSYLRTVHQSEMGYQSRNGRFATLAELKASNYLPPQDLSTYVVVLAIAADGAGFTVNATPLVQPTVLRHFFVDASGVVRYKAGAPADATSTPTGG